MFTSTIMPRHSHTNIVTFKHICCKHSRYKKKRITLKHSRVKPSVHWSSMELPCELLRASITSSTEQTLGPARSCFPEGSLEVHSNDSIEQPVPDGSEVVGSVNDNFFVKDEFIEEVLNLQPNTQNYSNVEEDILCTDINGSPSRELGTANHSNRKPNSEPLSHVSFLGHTNAMFTERQINELSDSPIDPTALKNPLYQSVISTQIRPHKPTVERHSCPISPHSKDLRHGVDGVAQNQHGSQDNGNPDLHGLSELFLPNEMLADYKRSQDLQKPVKQSTRQQPTSSDLTTHTQSNKKRKIITYTMKFKYTFEIFVNMLGKDYDEEFTTCFAELFLKQLKRIDLSDIKGHEKVSIQNIIVIVQFLGHVTGIEVFNDISGGPYRERSCVIPAEPRQNDNNLDDGDATENITMNSQKQTTDMNESQPKNENNIQQEQIFECDQLLPEFIHDVNELIIPESECHDAEDLLNNIEIDDDLQFDDNLDNQVVLPDGSIIQLPDDIDSYVPLTSDFTGINVSEIPGEVNNQLMNKINYEAYEYTDFKTDMPNENFTGGDGELSFDKTDYFETLKTLNLCPEQVLISDALGVVEPPEIKLEDMTVSDESYLQVVSTDKGQVERSYVELNGQSISEPAIQTLSIDNALLRNGMESAEIIFNSLIRTPEDLARTQLPMVPVSAACQLPLQHFADISDLSVIPLDKSHQLFNELTKVNSHWSRRVHEINSLMSQELHLQENPEAQLCSMDLISQVTSDPLAMAQIDVSNEVLLDSELTCSIKEIPAESVTLQGIHEAFRGDPVDGPHLSLPQLTKNIKTEDTDYYYKAVNTDSDAKPDIKKIRRKNTSTQEMRKSTRKKKVPDRLFYIGKGLQF